MPITAQRMTTLLAAALHIHKALEQFRTDTIRAIRTEPPEDATSTIMALAADLPAQTALHAAQIIAEYRYFKLKERELERTRIKQARTRMAQGVKPKRLAPAAPYTNPLLAGEQPDPAPDLLPGPIHIPSIYIDPARIAQAEAELDAEVTATPQPAGAGRSVDSNTELGPWGSPEAGFLELGDTSNEEDGAEGE